MRERGSANRTWEAGNLDEIQGVVANTVKLPCNGAVGFIGWLDRSQRPTDRNNACDAQLSTVLPEVAVVAW